MTQNMGTLDRGLRVLVAAPALAALGFFVFTPGSVASIIAFGLAGIMVATAAIGFCPLYVLPGISTCPLRAATGGKGGAATQG